MEVISKFKEKITLLVANGDLPPKLGEDLLAFYAEYKNALKNDPSEEKEREDLLCLYLEQIENDRKHPFQFEPFHEKATDPFDFYSMGVNFFRPLIDIKSSSVTDDANIQEALAHLKAGHNVIFLANHQTEADPQILSILLDEKYPGLAEDMIFVAGERVVIDPLSKPFSRGRNLLCIYSKRHIDYPPELKVEKQNHNKKTMFLMGSLLEKGGKCIYVAPSGGRDRVGVSGNVEVAPFDPQSVEMFYLIAKKTKTPTFFYPMTLGTYSILPPPEMIATEIGEERRFSRAPAFLHIGKCIDMEKIASTDDDDKLSLRHNRSAYIWNLVKTAYQNFC